jgi:hypothetical protein
MKISCMRTFKQYGREGKATCVVCVTLPNADICRELLSPRLKSQSTFQVLLIVWGNLLLYLSGICISVQKRYLFPPSYENDIFPPLSTHHFSTPIVAFLPENYPTLHLFPLFSFSSPFYHFFPFLPCSFTFSPFFSSTFYIFPKMTLANIPPPRGRGYFPIYRPLLFVKFILS